MKLLLVGHGYLGQAVASKFGDKGWDVIACSLSGDDGSIACDVGDTDSVRKLPPADLIIHCAASGRGGPDAYRHVYVEGCRNLTELFPAVPLIFTSSTSVYAQTDGSLVTEESETLPDRETGRLLLEAEHICLEASGTVLRLAGIYGPSRSVILKKFLNGESILENDGSRYLNQIHRDDAASAIFHVASQSLRGIFNVCDSTPLTQLDCFQNLCKTFSRPMPPSGSVDLDRKRAWTHKRVSNARLCKTGWQPCFPSFLDAVESVAPTL